MVTTCWSQENFVVITLLMNQYYKELSCILIDFCICGKRNILLSLLNAILL